jgi:hypothetical protein
MSTDQNVKPNRTIFRPEAIRRYTQRGERAVLPRFVSPRAFVFLWMLLGLLAASGFLAWFAQVPMYASGPAVVVEGERLGRGNQGGLTLALFLPSEDLSRLQVEQPLFVQFTPTGERLEGRIVAVEPEIIGPAAARQRFGLDEGTAQIVVQPAAVAITHLKPIPTHLPAETYLGSVYHVDVQVGSQRVLSLVPLIGQFFE